MKLLKITSIAIVALLAAVSCKSQYDLLLSGSDADAKYSAAFDYYNAGKYSKAAALFESLSAFTTGTSRDDSVQYYWGLSNYRFKDYYTAETNFQKFIETYPRSEFTPTARFLRLDCLYRSTLRYELDPSPTYTAISAINEYVTDYPESDHRDDCFSMLKDLGDRLDKKAYENAKLYYKMEDYKAARVAFKNVLKDDADNIYREDILYYTAMSSYKFAQMSVASLQKERYLTFIDDYLNFVGEIPDSPYRRQLKSLYVKAQKSIGKYVGTDDEEQVDDKQFTKERKESEKLQNQAEKAARDQKLADAKAEAKAEYEASTDVREKAKAKIKAANKKHRVAVRKQFMSSLFPDKATRKENKANRADNRKDNKASKAEKKADRQDTKALKRSSKSRKK